MGSRIDRFVRKRQDVKADRSTELGIAGHEAARAATKASENFKIYGRGKGHVTVDSAQYDPRDPMDRKRKIYWGTQGVQAGVTELNKEKIEDHDKWTHEQYGLPEEKA